MSKVIVYWDNTSDPTNPGWVAKDKSTGYTWQVGDLSRNAPEEVIREEAQMTAPPGVELYESDIEVVYRPDYAPRLAFNPTSIGAKSFLEEIMPHVEKYFVYSDTEECPYEELVTFITKWDADSSIRRVALAVREAVLAGELDRDHIKELTEIFTSKLLTSKQKAAEFMYQLVYSEILDSERLYDIVDAILANYVCSNWKW